MPQARNQAVTVRRPLAKRTPVSRTGSRAAEELCSHLAISAKALVRKGGRFENGKVGSLARDFVSKSHRVQGAGLRPPPLRSPPDHPTPASLMGFRLQADAQLVRRKYSPSETVGEAQDLDHELPSG